ncbi:MAG TPA: YtxH domain-containing protein [Vicinamibacterales bacterium]|jgi:gas vesicle protein
MSRWNEEDSGNSMFLLGALAGALVGAGVALLMAPKSGVEMRRELNSGLNTAKDAAARRYRDLAEKANQNYRELADKASQKLGQEDRTSTTTGERYNGGTTASLGDSFSATPGASGYQS